LFNEDRNEEIFDGEEHLDEQDHIMTVSTADTVHADRSELPTVEELSAIIKELSDTLVDISVNVHSEPSANELPSVSELSTTIQELSSTVLQMSTTTSEVSVAQAIQPSVIDPQPEFTQPLPSSETTDWCGFKLVGDNIDKNFRRSFHRHDKKTISMHAFHFYAVKDRIDLSSLSDFKPTPATVDVSKLLINEADVKQLNKEVIVLLSR